MRKRKYEKIVIKHLRLKVALVTMAAGFLAFLTFMHAVIVGVGAKPGLTNVEYILIGGGVLPWVIGSVLVFLLGVFLLLTVNYHYYQYDEPEETEQQEEKEKQAE